MLTHVKQLALVLVLALATLACGADERAAGVAQAGATSAPSTVAKAVETQPTAEMLAVLAHADRIDGTEDRIVTRCPGCSLAMDGSAEHAFKLGGYELHFCSETCRDHFREQPQAGIDALGEALQAADPVSGS